ncbi:MAG: hypothetical protein ACKVVP_07780 [Chloroflexota bacterium]
MRTILVLLLIAAAVSVIGPVIEGRERSAEQSVRGYVAAVQARDVSAALEWLEPRIRDEWSIFVEHQSGDRIRVISLSVERAALLSIDGRWGSIRSVTVLAEITGKSDERWQASGYVQGRVEGDRWLLDRPPFGPDEPWLVPPESVLLPRYIALASRSPVR